VLTGAAYQDAFFAWPRPAQERYVELVRAATTADPEWTAGFLRWLRVATPMRYPALVGAAAFTAERLAHGQPGLSRQVIASVLQRADDPGHLLAHWAGTYGASLPKPVKRGVADAVIRLYDEPALLAYDTGAHHFELGFVRGELPIRGGIRTPRPLRFGEVIARVHPKARDQEQGDLFRYALARRHGRVRTIPASLELVRRCAGGTEVASPVAWPEGLVAALRRGDGTGGAVPGQVLAQVRRLGNSGRAGAESVSASVPLGRLLSRGEGAGRAALEALIPSLPLSALLANLRRFDAVGIGFETAMSVAARIADPAEVRASGLLPLRFAAAWRAVASRRWEPVLAAGARYSLEAVPRLPGRTLVIIEPRDDTRIVFGLALAQRCAEADVVVAGGGRFPFEPGESPLHGLFRWPTTERRALGLAFDGHDRVVLVTEYLCDVPDVPADIPLYAWETKRFSRHEHPPRFDVGPRRGLFRGLGDPSFRVIPWWEELVKSDESGG
jgi:hypothetical protein